MREYKSLIGCTLIKKYKFEDYDKGGQDLLAEDRFLGGIMECTDAGQILIEEQIIPNFKGGEKQFKTHMYTDEACKIMRASLEPGAAIGVHTHETGSRKQAEGD